MSTKVAHVLMVMVVDTVFITFGGQLVPLLMYGIF